MLTLWNQENEVRVIQRRLNIEGPIVEVFSNDPRLLDLRAWDPERGRGRRVAPGSPGPAEIAELRARGGTTRTWLTSSTASAGSTTSIIRRRRISAMRFCRAIRRAR